jgi:inositol oxygenase
MARDVEKKPLKSMDDWEDDILERYPEKDHEAFRDYENVERDSVREFYRLNHENQTLEYARAKKAEFGALEFREMGIWEACEYLNELGDDSDPDTDLSQIQHLLQTSEAIRADGHPRWFVLTGLLHDLGKTLCFRDEPQWGVVGDTFPLGCKFSEKIVYSEFFANNPDSSNPELNTENGIYEPGCGLDKVTMSWGHDEYMYLVTKDYMPEESLYMVRFHSCYPIHREGAYAHLMNGHDREMFEWVKKFNLYDLYSKTDKPPNVDELKPYYLELIDEFFPKTIKW